MTREETLEAALRAAISWARGGEHRRVPHEIENAMADALRRESNPPCPNCGGWVGIVDDGEGNWFPRRDCMSCGQDTTAVTP